MKDVCSWFSAFYILSQFSTGLWQSQSSPGTDPIFIYVNWRHAHVSITRAIRSIVCLRRSLGRERTVDTVLIHLSGSAGFISCSNLDGQESGAMAATSRWWSAPPPKSHVHFWRGAKLKSKICEIFRSKKQRVGGGGAYRACKGSLILFRR